MKVEKQTVFTTVVGGQCVIEDFGAASVDGLPSPEYLARFGARVAIIWPCIFVSKTKEIPMDYPGPMAVPITFLDKYNPEQFEVIGKTHHGKLESGRETYQHVIVFNKRLRAAMPADGENHAKSPAAELARPGGADKGVTK